MSSENYPIVAVLSAIDKSFTSGFRKALDTLGGVTNRFKSGLGAGAFMAIGMKRSTP